MFKNELQRTRKRSLKMDEYLNKMKSIYDNLILAGCSISMDDLVTQTLVGLDIEYNPIVVQLVDKDKMTRIDIQATLLTYI